MVTSEEKLSALWRAAGSVADPEIPVLSITDLGVLSDIRLSEDGAEIFITPTYSGCPAMNMIALEIELAVAKAGLGPARVTTVLSPAWTTEWITEEGRQKLEAYGIAPPARGGGRRSLFGEDTVACPQCGSQDTREISPFGSTSCKALRQCNACREPFDYFKCH